MNIEGISVVFAADVASLLAGVQSVVDSVSSVSASAGSVQELSAAFDSVGSAASGTSGMVDELSASLDSVAGAVAPVEEVAASVDALDASLAGVDASASTAAVSLDDLAASATAVDASLASVDASAAATATAVAATATAADASALSMKNAAAAQTLVTDNADKFKALGMGIAVVGVAALAAGALAVHMAGDFQEGMTSLVTGAGESAKNIDMVRSGILKMSVDTATSTKQLTDGMYMIESSGYHGAQGLAVLQSAAEGAKVGSADLGTTANALTTILTDYHLKGTDAASAMNALTATVQSGKMKLQDLASSLGSVLPLASALHISFPQVAGAISTMTNAGMSADNASQNLANTIRSLAAPMPKASKAMAEVGISAQGLHDTLANKGLAAAIQMVEDHVGSKFPAGSVQAVQAFQHIMGGATGYNVALMLGGKNMATYENNIKSISGALNGGKGSVTGWADVQKDFNFKLEQAKQAGSAFMIMLGTELMPIFSKLVSNILPVITGLIAWETKTHTIQNAIFGLVQAIGNVITVGVNIVQFFQHNQAALVALGIALVIAAGIIGGILVAALVAWAVAAWGAAAGMIALTWPFMLIGAAIALLIVGIILLVQHWGQVVSFLQGVWQAFTSWFMGVLGAIGAFFQGVWNGIASFFIGVWQHIVSGVQAAWAMIINIVKIALLVLLVIIFAPIIAIAALFIWLYQHNTYFKMLVDAIINFVKAGVAWLVDAWHNTINWIVSAWQFLVTAATMYFMLVYVTISAKVQQVVGFLHGIWTSVIGFLSGIWATIATNVSQMWSKISGFFSSAWSTYISGPLNSLWSSITGFVSGWAGKAVEWGRNLIQGFINGITSMIGNVGSAVGNIASKIAANLGFHSPTKEGPGRELDVWAPNMVKEFAQGLDEGVPLIQAAVTHLIQPTSALGSYAGGSNTPSSSLQGNSGGGQSHQEHHFHIYLDGNEMAPTIGEHIVRSMRIATGSKAA